MGSPENNQISDISPLSSLTKLKELRMWNNQVKDISSLISLNALKVLWILQGNPLSDESMNIYIPQLKMKGIQVM
jgi:Leucine-rich repeat (LRR) protein